MKKILPGIIFLGVMGGNEMGQGAGKNASVNVTCPPIYILNPDANVGLAIVWKLVKE